MRVSLFHIPRLNSNFLLIAGSLHLICLCFGQIIKALSSKICLLP